MRSFGFLAVVAALILLGGSCGSNSTNFKSADTLADCAEKEYKSLRAFKDDKGCQDLIDKQVEDECYLEHYSSRQEIEQQKSRTVCQEALSFQSDHQAKEAELRDMTFEEFVESELISNVLRTKDSIPVSQAVAAVKESSIFKQLISVYPELEDKAEFYTSRSVKSLAESELWFPITQSIKQFDEDNLNEPVWQVLVTCLEDCNDNLFFRALSQYAPASTDEGMNESYSDLIFVVHARTGAIIMYERGSGQRGDAIDFKVQWLEFSE